MGQNDNAPRIIKKKKHGHGGHHGGAWKVAYADFVTAMMALFIVLWIVGQSKQVKAYVAHYFKDPGAMFENTKGGGLFEGESVLGMEQVLDDQLKRAEKEKLEKLAEEMIQELSGTPQLAHVIGQITIEIVNDGLRIELLDKSESFFFDIGTAKLKKEAVQVLTAIADEIDRLPNHIIIEGHTDSRPYSQGNGYTNFELSADRANSARRVLVQGGVQFSKIDEIRGYADSRLRNKEDPFDISNRRISIIIKFHNNKGTTPPSAKQEEKP
jgi:chemotaxis protein MotB